MRKVFLDVGGWNGASAIFFRKYHPQGAEFEIFTFEPDVGNIKAIKAKHLPITLIEKAAWSSTGRIKFYPGGAMPGSGGTLYPQKITGNINPKNYYEVETISLADFIVQHFTSDDYIIIKMNCEGAEYELIPHLAQNNLTHWIKKWYVQWHYEKIKMSRMLHESVKMLIPPAYEWDCQCNEATFKTKFLATL